MTAALLVTVWGGTQYPWGSTVIVGLAVVAVVLIAAFVLWERHAAEPILPPSLYHIGIFRVSTSVSFLLAMIMFGAIIYLPLYLQLVDGVSAMVSGLLMIPLMIGVLGASVLSGQMVSAPVGTRCSPSWARPWSSWAWGCCPSSTCTPRT